MSADADRAAADHGDPREAASDDPAARVASLERELAQARATLEDFTYSVSHDLRAPLRHVISYLKILSEDIDTAPPEEIAGYLKTASDSAALMGRQIDGLLQLSRLGRADLQASDLDLSRLVSDIRAELEPQCAGRRIHWRIDPALPALHVDVALVGQALRQLLANALKFSAARDPAEIEIRARPGDDGMVAITVADNGVGFDPRYADRLFKVFQRLHGSQAFEGLGIGLTIVRMVAERHGGQASAQGAPGQGCQVTITLPAVRGLLARPG